MRTIREVRDALPAADDAGLDPAAVAESRRRFGANCLTALPREPIWKKFLDKFDEPIIKVLLAAALLSMFVDLFGEQPAVAGAALGAVALAAAVLLLLRRSAWVPSLLFASALVLFLLGLAVPPHHSSVEGLAVMVAVILATGVSFLSEYRSDREFEVLNARKESLRAKVTRGGQFHTVALEEVVGGDVVSLEMGDEVPADGRLVKAADLYLDQSLMTGESEPVHKKAVPDDAADGFDCPGCLYRGTQVVDGVGQMVVTEVGDATQLGQIARRLSSEADEGAADDEEARVKRKLTISKELTPLQEKLKRLAELISKVGYVAAVLIFVALLVRGAWVGELRWPRSSENLVTISGFNGGVNNVVFSPDGRRVAFGRAVEVPQPNGAVAEAGEIVITDSDGRDAFSFRAHADRILSIAFSPDGERLASTGVDGTLKLWDARKGEAIATIPAAAAGDNPFVWLAFADGKRLVVKESAGVTLWDLEAARPLRTFGKGEKIIYAVAVSPDGRRLAATGIDGGVMVWDLFTGEQLLSLRDGGPAFAVAFSPDGRLLAAGGFDGQVMLHDAGTGDLLRTFSHGETATRLAFSPDGTRLASASSAERLVVKTWDTTTGRLLDTRERRIGLRGVTDLPPVRPNIGAVYDLRFHDGGLLVASTRDQRSAEVWEATTDEDFWTTLLADAGVLLRYFTYMVIIIVVAVPEGLPMSVTVSLALAMRRMTRENSLVRQLVACETIGSATVICSDKTGTMTQNRMQVVGVFLDGRGYEGSFEDGLRTQLISSGVGDWPSPGSPLDWLVLNAAVNSTAELEEKGGRLVPVGNSTEAALLLWLHGGAWFRHGEATAPGDLDYRDLRRRFPLLYTVHFSSDRKRMTSVVRHGERLVALAKGAPEWVLDNSTHYQAHYGTALPWTPEAREAAARWLRESSARAMRTLAFGYAVLPPETPADENALHARQGTLESGLVFIGVAAIRDPLRPDVKAAIEECRRARIDVMMITGDNVETARAIAGEVGLVAPDAAIDTADAPVMTSAALEALDDDGLKARLPGLRVVARARPLDKLRLVKALQELGQVVAVTGDGTNDAPALKRADVGLAMGIAGTEVAKEASKIVLLDDSFSTIVKAVHWGRSLYENIQRFLQFQLTINVSALAIALIGPFFGVKPPFTVLQLLWINVIMDTFASIALCSEPPRPGVMSQPPKRRDESILTRPMLATIFSTAAFFVVVMMTLLAGMAWYGWFRGDGAPSPDFPELTVHQVSIFFSVYVFFQVWNQVNCRSLTPDESGLSGLRRNPTFLAIAGTVALVQVLIVSVPFLARVFKVAPLGLVDWAWVVVGTASVLLFSEAARQVRRALGTA
jgi:magnesium-transporting ATPase (P-type)/WD40 repeat protein